MTRKLCDSCLRFKPYSHSIIPVARYHVITYQNEILSVCAQHSKAWGVTAIFTSRKKAQEELLKRSL